MKATQQLHEAGQSLWLDNITRALLTSGTLCSYIDDLSVTGLTSNPSIFDVAIKDSNLYDDAIRQKAKEGKSGEVLFFELAIDDLREAADLFRPVHDSTGGVDGWVSLEVSPLLEAEYVVLGGGNAKHIRDLPPDIRMGDNRNAFVGGSRLWERKTKPFGGNEKKAGSQKRR